ncbi:uncharacterized protein LOC132740264 [Ruditapes philippinarum]|uniref:uncharacterized protein LOC132740264 n=1 Tax=Ruditapes philippinarum TaxID=129788 RepID=UPI00295C132D|nr:uncharacterized protein LOC132740264 [Ruditapes philippinarum]
MASICVTWCTVIFFLSGFIFKSEEKEEKEITICFKGSPQCVKPAYTLSCNDELIQRIKNETRQCYHYRSSCDVDLIEECDYEKTCQFSNSKATEVVKEIGGLQSSRSVNIYVRVSYNCSGGDSKGALPVSSNPDNAGSGGVSPAVVVPIIVVLAILIIVSAVFGIVLYRRQSQRKRSQDSKCNEQPNKNRDEDNPGFDGEYNTIPADYGVAEHHTYNTLEHNNADNLNATEIRRGDSVNYSTIFLNEESKNESSAYGYDTANHKTKYEPGKVMDLEGLHSYGHFSEQSGDYNRMNPNTHQNPDKDYSHFDSGESFDYSHLNEKQKQVDSNLENDYNHIQTLSKPTRRVDSYEQPILKELSQAKADDVETKLDTSNNSSQYETAVIDDATPKLNVTGVDITNNSRMKRKDSYEDPVKINADTHHAVNDQPNENLKPRDDYEAPITIQTESLDTLKEPSSKRMQRRDSYEQPVLIGSSDHIT